MLPSLQSDGIKSDSSIMSPNSCGLAHRFSEQNYARGNWRLGPPQKIWGAWHQLWEQKEWIFDETVNVIIKINPHFQYGMNSNKENRINQ